jgi:signal transduction histidine kinase
VVRRAAALLGAALDHARACTAMATRERDMRALEAQAIQNDKLATFGQIAAGMVHELNNPLTSIVAYADFLARRFARGPGTEVEAEDVERVKRISDSANRMLRFTRDLVAYARPSGDTAIPVVLHTVIEQAIAFCEHVLHEAGATVKRELGPDVLTVRGMPEQLAQVFVNLLTNACHALPDAKGEIVIATALVEGGARVQVTVCDNGHGIAKENLAHVFAPFFTTKKREGRGTGLGLSIVKSIVENHGGDIRVESRVGDGARFILRLPVGRAATRPPPAQK